MSTIPQTVDLDRLVEAIAPLMELLGTTFKSIYAYPGLTIMGDQIVFTVAAGEDRLDGRTEGIRAEDHPQGDEAAELAHIIRVQVVLR